MITIEDMLKRKDEELVYEKDKKKKTYKNLKELLSQYIYKFYEKKFNDNVTTIVWLAYDGFEIFVLNIMASILKINIVGINYTLSEIEINFLINQINPELIIYDRYNKDKLKKCKKQKIDINDLKSSCNKLEFTNILIKKKENKIMLLTSGTSGCPKIIVKTKSDSQKRKENILNKIKFKSKKIKYLQTMPMYHASTLGWIKLVLELNGSIIVPKEFSDIEVTKSLEKFNYNFTLISPNRINIMMKKPNSKIDAIVIGGGYLSQRNKHKAQQFFGKNIYQYYGTSETGVNTLDKINLINNKLKSLTGVKFLIKNKKEIKNKGFGQLLINSYEIFDGYMNKNINFFKIDNEKYFLTNDYVYLEDQNITIYYRGDYINNKKKINYNKYKDLIELYPGVYDIILKEDTKGLECNVELYKDINRIEFEMFVRQIIEEKIKILYQTKIKYSLTGKVIY